MLSLNREQEKSVRRTQGNSLVIAGAGSGKTRTLIAKIIYLIQNQKTPPHHILAITFTNKAAREMRERVETLSHQKLLGQGSQGLQIRTFHSFGVMLLRRFLHGFGRGSVNNYGKNFTIIDPDDQKRILRNLYPDYSISEFPLKQYLYLITAFKNNFIYPEDEKFEDKAREYYEDYGLPENPIDVYCHYMDSLQKQNLLDFDDLIGLSVKLLKEYPPASTYAKERWHHILVDEYQDTNYAQEKIIEFFIQQGSRVTVVGDDQQSIYGFRGARMDNILTFKNKYPRVETFILEENYRSTQSILDLANHVIAKNPAVFPKKLFTSNTDGEIPVYYRFANDLEEAKWLVETIDSLKEGREKSFLDKIAVFYRTNYQSRIFEDILIRYRLPYQIVRGQKFYERKEIKDVLSYLQWLVNPQDQISFERMVNTPPRRLGKKTLERVFSYLEKHSLSLSNVFAIPEIIDFINQPVRQNWKGLGNMFREIQERLESKETPSKIINYLIQKSGLQNLYESEADKMIRDQRLGNLDALFEAVDNFVNETGGGVEDFLDSLSLGEEKEDNGEEKIKLMTVHNAKGLEFEVVFVVGLEEGVFPHSLTLENNEEIEEERRLFYVAITRARKKLFLSSAALKYRYQNMSNFPESRFIKEVENTFLVKEKILLNNVENKKISDENSNNPHNEYY